MAAKSWTPKFKSKDGPIYLAIADSIAADIASGKLSPGTRLPTQRRLAEDLDIDFTTVNRGYSEAQGRGLIEGRVGQGTFVKARQHQTSPLQPSGLVDMSMNLPPRFQNHSLTRRMWEAVSNLEDRGLDLLMRYQEPGGIMEDRMIATSWLAKRVPSVTPDRVLVAAGAQGALLAVLSVLAGPGDTVCVEHLTYPGFRSIASHLRLKLAPLAMDEHGLLPEAFERACQTMKPKAMYCMPTLHNPTTRTMPLVRRRELLDLARAHEVPVIEDDAYGSLASDTPAPLAALAPDIVYHVASLSKCLSPALRVAYVAVPEERALRVANAMRASASIVSPLASATASQWIGNGLADLVRDEIVQESAIRLRVFNRTLPDIAETSSRGFHAWLSLPEPWPRGELVSRLRSVGVGVVVSDAFAVADAPEAIRIGLGAPATVEELDRSLVILADILSQLPAISTMVV
ncbi:aminotransferase-like domain-containing protein [Endobacterium cereale]|uniref:aminotransferase-like domain-containing protein n=1 Tax=Endobacterium cereale TaxID=2663029 RepID=UPI002B476699|nr:PLP-dependent aminotransferase family protein [Endobacterium cereale]MEB2848078.1 PLP-dependent aminotransferase family protein [Endobacterium cereale]